MLFSPHRPGANSVPPNPLAGFEGSLRGGVKRGGNGRKGRERKGTEGTGEPLPLK